MVFISTSYGIYILDHSKKSSVQTETAYPPDYKILINKTFKITLSAHYEPIHYFCDDVTTSFISNNVNFSNYWVELDVNTNSFVYFKSVLNSTSNCCNYPPLCNCSTEENGGEFVYDKQSKYVHSTRGKWQIKIQIDYEASLTVFLYTYGGNKLFLNTH